VVCGEGVARSAECGPEQRDPAAWDARGSFGSLSARALDAELSLVCYGGLGVLQDWRGNRDVLTIPEVFELAVPDDETLVLWDHLSFRPDAVVVGIGNNDFDRSLHTPPEREEFVGTYVAFVHRLLTLYPEAHVWLSDGPMVRNSSEGRRRKDLLQDYLRTSLERIESDRVHFIAATEQPGDACDAHPTREQHREMAAELVPEIRRTLEW
jgi:hypothetical protein